MTKKPPMPVTEVLLLDENAKPACTLTLFNVSTRELSAIRMAERKPGHPLLGSEFIRVALRRARLEHLTPYLFSIRESRL
jgi:hypothetical protein